MDTTTPVGAALANVLGSFAQLERDMIASRTREALQAKKRLGDRLGAPVQLDNATRQRIYAARQAGMTLRAIAAELTAEGIPTARGGQWHAVTVSAVIRSVELDLEAAAATA